MSDSPHKTNPLDTIQPVVLAGGKSVRFGRDKLREPLDHAGTPLVTRPIAALREVFGARVKLVGACHPSLLPLADGALPDTHPGAGPIGGIVSALAAWGGPVFVLAGDMPEITAQTVSHILAAAHAHPDALATLARTDRLHPCVGLYTRAALAPLLARLAGGHHRLLDALPAGTVHAVTVDSHAMANLNTPPDAARRAASLG